MGSRKLGLIFRPVADLSVPTLQPLAEGFWKLNALSILQAVRLVNRAVGLSIQVWPAARLFS